MRITVPVHGTALLLIDVQNDFCASKGKMAAFGADLSMVKEAVYRMEKLAAAARRAGIPVIFVRLVTMPGADSPAMAAFYERQGYDVSAMAVCRAGTFGAEFYSLSPECGDLIVDKMRYSGFHGTNLDLILRAKGIGRLAVAGVTTECCVDTTVRDAFARDYETFVVGDACAAYEKDLHEISLKAIAINFATVVTTEETAAGWTFSAGEGAINENIRNEDRK